MIYNVQGLRLLAAMSIVIAHIILFGNNKYGLNAPRLDALADYLMIGVDIFFIISGFIMVHTKQVERPDDTKQSYLKTAARFFYKRATRIYPVYWLLCIALLPVFFMAPEWINSGADEPTSLLHSFLLLPDKGVPLIMVAWTLEFEMFFYVLFALTLWFRLLTQLCILTALLGGMAAAGFIWPDLQSTNAFMQLITSSLLLYFVLGMWMGFFFDKIKHINLRLMIAPVFLSIAIFWMLQHRLGEIDRFLHFGGTAFFIMIITLLCEKKEWTPFKTIQKWGGNISYSLYLIHVLALSAWGKILAALIGKGMIMSTLFVSGTIIGCLISATMLYYLFEKPALKFLRKFTP